MPVYSGVDSVPCDETENIRNWINDIRNLVHLRSINLDSASLEVRVSREGFQERAGAEMESLTITIEDLDLIISSRFLAIGQALTRLISINRDGGFDRERLLSINAKLMDVSAVLQEICRNENLNEEVFNAERQQNLSEKIADLLKKFFETC